MVQDLGSKALSLGSGVPHCTKSLECAGQGTFPSTCMKPTKSP